MGTPSLIRLVGPSRSRKKLGLKDLKIFHAGTALSGDAVVSTGGESYALLVAETMSERLRRYLIREST